MASIRNLKDNGGNVFYPLTHERAVKDSNGVSLETKLAGLESKSYVEAWDGASTPVVANIPAGVTVTYNTTTYTGTLAASASTIGKIYLVKNGSNYDRYITSQSGSSYSWKPIGSTELDLTDYPTKEEIAQSYATFGDLNQVIEALLGLVPNLAFSNANAQGVYNSFVSELSNKVVVSISAEYAGGSVSVFSSLEELRNDLTVTVYTLDGVTYTTQLYTLSGVIESGNCDITVSYKGATTVFTVVVNDPFNEMENNKVIVGFESNNWTPSGHISARRDGQTARASLRAPLLNRGFIFTAVDDTKYQFAAHNIVSLQKTYPNTPDSTYCDGYGYLRPDSNAPSWTNYAAITSDYVWLTVKKVDGSNFTSEELANAVGTIFTYTYQG